MSNDAYGYAGYWADGYSQPVGTVRPFYPLDTVLPQYVNSPSIVQLIVNFNQQNEVDSLFARFESYIWNVTTAQGFGLDILGRLVGIPRQLDNVPKIYPDEGDAGPVSMTDDQYRRALLVKAHANIGDHSMLSINYGMRIMANGRGNAFASKTGTMTIDYNFYYGPEGYEYAVINSGDILIRPVGVGTDRRTLHQYFGFDEAESWNTFDQAVFAAY